jgi:hypothetical protein
LEEYFRKKFRQLSFEDAKEIIKGLGFKDSFDNKSDIN